jgi:hypothetical protein
MVVKTGDTHGNGAVFERSRNPLGAGPFFYVQFPASVKEPTESDPGRSGRKGPTTPEAL